MSNARTTEIIDDLENYPDDGTATGIGFAYAGRIAPYIEQLKTCVCEQRDLIARLEARVTDMQTRLDKMEARAKITTVNVVEPTPKPEWNESPLGSLSVADVAELLRAAR